MIEDCNKNHITSTYIPYLLSFYYLGKMAVLGLQGHYEDGQIELYDGTLPLTFRLFYDRLSVVDSGAIVSNKRLGPILEMIKAMQDQNPQLRSQKVPSHSHLGIPHAKVVKRQRDKVNIV